MFVTCVPVAYGNQKGGLVPLELVSQTHSHVDTETLNPSARAGSTFNH